MNAYQLEEEVTRENEKLCPGDNEEDNRCELGLWEGSSHCMVSCWSDFLYWKGRFIF